MTGQLGAPRPFTYQHDGLTLAYAVVGDGPQPVLFVHGATATGEFEWAGLAAALGPGTDASCPIYAAMADRNSDRRLRRGPQSAPTCGISSSIWTWAARTSWVSPMVRRLR